MHIIKNILTLTIHLNTDYCKFNIYHKLESAMVNKKKRFFIKTITKLGLLSLIPIELFAIEEKSCEVTSSDIEGPFYNPNSPNIIDLTPPEINSNFLFITGTIYANDCITPIPNAIVDVWHANQGEYDTKTNTYLNSSYEDDFYRGKIYTNQNGNYAYKTILPGKYLNGTYYRPSHIHYKASYLTNEITTQLYFEGDTSIPIDAWASNLSAENRIINLNSDKKNNLHGVFDIILNINPIDILRIDENNKIINSIFPNPVNNTTKLYLQNQEEKIIIQIYNVNGKIINTKEYLQINSINFNSILPANINKGVYVLTVKNNNGKTDSKRFCI